MSSSNEVNIIYAPELTTYGVVDPGTDFETVRKTSETLSGTPVVSVSEEARSDRQSGGQTLVNVGIAGGTAFELSASKYMDDFLEAGMAKTWTAKDTEVVDMDIDVGAGTLTRVAGDFTVKVSDNNFITLQDFDDAENNTTIFVTNVTALVINFVGPSDMITDAASVGTSYIVPKNTSIGVERKSFSIEKQFTDLTTKYIAYSGMRVGQFSLEYKTGDPVVGEFIFGGEGYTRPSVSISDGETVNPEGSALIINSTVDMGVLIIDDVVVPYCVESIKVDLNNNLSPQNCIGKVGPNDQIPFEATVTVDLTAHLEDTNFNLLDDKISQTPIAIALNVRGSDGLGYAIFIPRVQLSFPDPNMTGKNTHVMINASGVASFDTTSDNTLFLYRLED